MKKTLQLFSLLAILLIAGNAKSQSVAVGQSTMYVGQWNMIDFYGTGTDFTSGGLSFYFISASGSDTLYPQPNTPFDPVYHYGDFYVPCTAKEESYTLYFYDVADGMMTVPNAINVVKDFGIVLDIGNVTCHNLSDGYIYAYAGGQIHQGPGNSRGGAGGFSYLWSTGDTLDNINYLSPGSYSVIITDLFSGCKDTLYATLINPPAMEVNWTKIDANCGMLDGMAFIESITGGMGPYSIFWGPGEWSTDTITNLGPGTDYNLSVSDSFNCYYYVDFGIYEQLSLNFSTINTTCGNPGGTATVTVVNGVAPFTYTWSNGDTGITADSLAAGQYAIEVSDNSGCYGEGVVNIIGTDGPQITSVITGAPTCNGVQNGSVDITVSGGTAPYSYNWSNGATTQDLVNVQSGTYEISVTDATGCAVSQCINLAENTKVTIDYTWSWSPDCGFANGQAEAWTYGGVPPVSIQWDAAAGSQTGNYAYGLTSGIYKVIATDALGCSDSAFVLVSDWAGPYVLVDSTSSPTCGALNGAIYISPGGGSGAPYTYEWSNGNMNEDLVGIDPGIYFVTITDNSGCKGIETMWMDGNAVTPQDICIVTVDSLTGANLVAWEKPVVTDIDHYNIYREACGDINGFVWIGSVPYDSLSTFIDHGANPKVKSWRYRMTAVDICGTESTVSPVHKTIHLSVTRLGNNQTNLNWDRYVGFTYNEQMIWRYHNSTGWTIIDTVAGAIRSYVDTSVLAIDSVQYMIEISSPAGCLSTRAENHNTTRSNRGTLAAPNNDNVEQIENEHLLKVYPNPSEGIFNLQFMMQTPGTTLIRVYDMSGKLIRNIPLNVNNGINNYQLNLEGFPSGIYHVVLSDNSSSYGTRIIKQ